MTDRTDSPPTCEPFAEAVLGASDNEYHTGRERLEQAVLLAVAELFAHTRAANMSGLEGFGVSVSASLISMNG